jgi:hypothetical protein
MQQIQLRWVKASERFNEGVYPVRITSNTSGFKVFAVGLFTKEGFQMATYLNKTILSKEELANDYSVEWLEEYYQQGSQPAAANEAPCAFEHPELYTGSLCGKCNQAWPMLKECPQGSQPTPSAVPEEKLPSNIPDGEGDWQTGAETFTRQEVFKMLYTQRAMIQNDLKWSCWNELPETAKDIVLNPRKPQI